ncbi:MAG: C25 family cysteine peptidase, partial [Bacteroidota bacterium]
MKKITFFISFLLLAVFVNAANWIPLSSQTPKDAKVELISSDGSTSLVKITLGGYYSNPVVSAGQPMTSLNVPNSSAILEKGAPDLRKITTALMIPDLDAMDISVVSSSYVDYSNQNIIPSKGNLYRNVNPSSVPLSWGQVYQQDAFYPGKLASLSDPYIVRDYRGVSVSVFPFQYNPVKKVLRVYKEIIVKIKSSGPNGVNPLIRTKSLTKVDNDFNFIYQRRFLNFGSSKYTPVGEQGKMLVICYSQYMEAMQPFIDWKKTAGMPTEMVNVTTIGNTSAAIKTYITNYYNTNGLTYVVLVGDATQVATYVASSGDSDNSYGFIVGSDHYPDVFVGRFSAESIADVETQVTRVLQYEKTPNTTINCYGKTVQIGSDQGPGDDNEYDYQHEHNIRVDLLAYEYASGWELYDGTQTGAGYVDAAGDPTAANLTTCLNTGAGIITYCGHGSDDSFVTTGFSNTDVNALNNVNMLPFIFSVACVNGNFVGQTCFAESWLRARKTNGDPTGAIATLMSTINQSWDPPMEGQDEMVDILTEQYTANIKHKFGAISMNGCMKMNDTYTSGGYEMTDTWNIFGDPSLMVRTDTPKVMTCTHPASILIGSTSMIVNCNIEGALVALTINNEIIGTGTVASGQANISFTALTAIDTITVCATAYNYIPYLGEVPIVNSVGVDENQIPGLSVYPNPASGSFSVEYFLNEASNVSLQLFDATGRLQKTVMQNTKTAVGFQKC